MSRAKAYNLKQAYQMATSGKYQQVELAFDVDADTFFYVNHQLWFERGENRTPRSPFCADAGAGDLPHLGLKCHATVTPA